MTTRVVGGRITRQTIQLTGDVEYIDVGFYAVTLVASSKLTSVILGNCAFHNCTFVYDGMEVDFQEWVTLTRRMPTQETPDET